VRRLLIRLLGVSSVLLSVPSLLHAFFINSFLVRSVEKDTFRFEPETGTIYWKGTGKREPFRMTVDGLVEEPVRFTYEDLLGLPQTAQVSDFHCVEGWSVKDVSWKGIRFEEIIKRVKPKADAEYAMFHALGETASPAAGLTHYIESFPVRELLDPKKACLLALVQGGKPLSHDHGAPCRVVSPFDLAYKGIKYVTRIEFSRQQRPGWWTLANPIYPMEAPVPADRLRSRE
jgi:DMSO/TMAO reductase YedYZ molybdopterin-dependent catalytic subunit